MWRRLWLIKHLRVLHLLCLIITVCCFDIVGDIMLCACSLGAKKNIFSWVLPLWFRLCLVCRGYRDRGWEVSFDAPFAFRIRRSSPKSKVVGRSPALLRIYKSFLILSLLTLFIEKFACLSSIMDPKAQERICRFVFTTESWQYWDLI